MKVTNTVTLEDFFTLTEMKHGLAAPVRVEELLSVMTKEKDSPVKHVGDATRQWAAVASTIAATENKECLDLFVQLNGLWFIDKWLKDAQTFGTEGSDCFVEEAMIALLQAVETFHVDKEKLVSSEICSTVKSLLSYKNTRVQNKARTLLDNWKAKGTGLLSTVSALNSERAESQSAADDVLPVHEHQNLDCVEREIMKVSEVRDSSQKTSDHTGSKDVCLDTIASSVKLKCGEGNVSVMKDVDDCDGKSDMPCSSDQNQVTVEGVTAALKFENVAEEVRHNSIENVVDRLYNVEVSSASDTANALTKDDSTDSNEVAVKPDLDANNTSCKNSDQVLDESKNEMDDSVDMEQKGLDHGGSALTKSKDQGMAISMLNDGLKYDEAKKKRKSNKYFGNACEFTMLTKSSKNADFIGQTDMDLEDGTVDALDFARLVAKEIEREVVGYDEQSDSSSDDERTSKSSTRRSVSPESINEDQFLQTDAQADELAMKKNVTLEASDREIIAKSASEDIMHENHIQDMESSQVTGALLVLEENAERNACAFDLNEELSSEEHHEADTVSNPVQVEKTLSGGGTCSSSRQRQDLVDFDLNVAEGGDDKPIINKQTTMLPGLLSGESSVELSPKRSERLKFDLNQIDEDGDLLASDWNLDGNILETQNCRCSPSPASSSSCLQPSMRNFDLNDNPSSCNSVVDHPTFLGESSSFKTSPYPAQPDDSVISILGTKVKKNTSPQILSPFSNGRVSEPVMDSSLLRGTFVGIGPSVSYMPSVYGYNGLAMDPVVPFPPGPTYGPGGPIPYMFVSRGAPVMSHMIGSPPTAASSYSQSSLVMNMMGTTPGSNGIGSLRPNLDLNSGYAVEAANQDPAFFRPLFNPGHGRPVDEQLRDNLRPFNMGSTGVKRKEPETGWEFYPTNYKHHQPPHL